MAYQTIHITCPGCGARVTIDQKECEWCNSPIIISSFYSVYSMSLPEVSKFLSTYQNALSASPGCCELNHSVAMCYLKLKMYSKALSCLEKAIEANFDNSETYFYAAVCLLQGKKAFLQRRSDIDKVIEYINAAIMIEPRGIYHYFLSYIKYDYFERKCLNTTPNYRDCLRTAKNIGLSEFDIKTLYDLLCVSRPSLM